jgi:hypothetical protein
MEKAHLFASRFLMRDIEPPFSLNMDALQGNAEPAKDGSYTAAVKGGIHDNGMFKRRGESQ